jgi:hypothetical protein
MQAEVVVLVLEVMVAQVVAVKLLLTEQALELLEPLILVVEQVEPMVP